MKENRSLKKKKLFFEPLNIIPQIPPKYVTTKLEGGGGRGGRALGAGPLKKKNLNFLRLPLLNNGVHSLVLLGRQELALPLARHSHPAPDSSF